jgi:hypothetical protein
LQELLHMLRQVRELTTDTSGYYILIQLFGPIPFLEEPL